MSNRSIKYIMLDELATLITSWGISPDSYIHVPNAA
jgi:hypothetical protein